MFCARVREERKKSFMHIIGVDGLSENNNEFGYFLIVVGWQWSDLYIFFLIKKKSYKSKKNEEHPSSESEGSDNEEVDDLPLEIIQKKGKERTSVSAEAFGTHNKKE